MTTAYESPRLWRGCLVCSYKRPRLTVVGFSVRGVRAGGWRLWAAPAMPIAAAGASLH